MSGGDQVLATLKQKYPNGVHLLVFHMDTLLAADQQVRPIEDWAKQDVDRFEVQVKQAFSGLRQKWSDPEQAAETARQHGMPIEEVRERHRAAKAYMAPVIEQAKNLAGILFKRLRDEKTREETLLFLRAWYDNVRQANLSRYEAATSLQGFLAAGGKFLKTASDELSRGILLAMERGTYQRRDDDLWPSTGGVAKFQTKDGTTGFETWRHSLMPADLAKRQEEFLPAPDIDSKAIEAIEVYRKSLGDLDSDLMCFAMARYAERAKRPGDEVWIGIDELMAALGRHKQEGGGGGKAFRAEDKRRIRSKFERLADGFLTIHRAFSKRGRGSLDVQSQVMVITNRVGGQADLDGRVPEWERCSIVMGRAWSMRLFDDRGRLLALMQERALQYHPERQRIEKRICKRLAFFWRLNPGKAQRSCTVAEWLREEVGDPKMQTPEGLASIERRDAMRLEEAFNRLLKDEQIKGWRYVDGMDKIEAVEHLPRGWREKWLEREILVDIPAHLRTAYEIEFPSRPGLAAPTRIESTLIVDLPARFLKARKDRGLTQQEVARIVGINSTVLSAIENGRRQPSKSHAAAMEAWLREPAAAKGH